MTRASPLVIARFRASQLPTGGSAGRGAPTWCRAWLGGRVNTRNRPEDRWDPRVVGAPQAAAVEPPRADPLGHRPPPGL